MNHSWTFLLLGLLLVASFTEAKTIEELNITDTFLSNFKIRETVVMTVLDNTHDAVAIGVPEDAFDAEVDGRSVAIKDNAVEVQLDCVLCVVNVEYTVPSVLEEKEEMFGFFKNFLEYDVHRLNYRLVLPKGYGPGYISEGSEPAIPPPMKTGKDGSRVFMEWHEVDPELPKVYYVRMKAEKENRSKTLTIFVILAVIVLGISLLRRRQKNLTEKASENKDSERKKEPT